MVYQIITDSETDPEAPITSELAKKWRDNAAEAAWYNHQYLANGSGITRAIGSTYQNTTGRQIFVAVAWGGTGNAQFEISADNVNFSVLFELPNAFSTTVIPPDYYYRLRQVSGSSTNVLWREIR